MKKILALTLVSVILLMVGATGASAGHKLGHQEPPACEKTSNGGGKHCYPPRGGQANNGGSAINFTTDAPTSSGLTVGMAALIAVGGVGTLLVVRRRWTFRTNGR